MRILFCIFFIFAFTDEWTPIFAAQKPETPHLAFVTEYIRELAAIETIRDGAKAELKEGDDSGKLSSAIHANTLFQLELQSEIAMLKSMRLNPPYNALLSEITGFYDFKIAVYKRLTQIVRTILSGAGGPKPGVDYAALGAEMPELRARLDYIDHALLSATPLIFLTLVDPKPDSKNHVSHMIITKAERDNLIDSLNRDFGEKLDEKDQNFGVSAASVLRSFLSERKCSDDPWE